MGRTALGGFWVPLRSCVVCPGGSAMGQQVAQGCSIGGPRASGEGVSPSEDLPQKTANLSPSSLGRHRGRGWHCSAPARNPE